MFAEPDFAEAAFANDLYELVGLLACQFVVYVGRMAHAIAAVHQTAFSRPSNRSNPSSKCVPQPLVQQHIKVGIAPLRYKQQQRRRDKDCSGSPGKVARRDHNYLSFM